MTSKRIQFSKYNPSGNMTVLVHSKHDKASYVSIANQIMQTSHICCEQVGFIESDQSDAQQHFHLVMSGNEFCGNAAISFMHYLNEQRRISTTGKRHESNLTQFQMQISGRSDLVECNIHHDGYYEVMMPQPETIVQRQLTLDNQSFFATAVRYESYVHYVIHIETQDISNELQQSLEHFVRSTQWNNVFKTIGIMLFDRGAQFLTPLIYLPEVQSCIWEHSCGSGAASIGIVENDQKGNDIESLTVYQPGGHMIVTSKLEDKATYNTTIKGKVATIATGTAYIE